MNNFVDYSLLFGESCGIQEGVDPILPHAFIVTKIVQNNRIDKS